MWCSSQVRLTGRPGLWNQAAEGTTYMYHVIHVDWVYTDWYHLVGKQYTRRAQLHDTRTTNQNLSPSYYMNI